MTRLMVTVAATGAFLGWAELGDDNKITTSGPAVARMFVRRWPGQTEADVFARYASGWSNGYLVIAPVISLMP